MTLEEFALATNFESEEEMLEAYDHMMTEAYCCGGFRYGDASEPRNFEEENALYYYFRHVFSIGI